MYVSVQEVLSRFSAKGKYNSEFAIHVHICCTFVVHVYVCVYMYVCICMCTCICMCVYVYVCAHVKVCVYICARHLCQTYVYVVLFVRVCCIHICAKSTVYGVLCCIYIYIYIYIGAKRDYTGLIFPQAHLSSYTLHRNLLNTGLILITQA
jgi:hypothetical protein